MYVRGPGVAANETRAHPSNHLDITATIVDLAGASEYTPGELDGKTFSEVLGSNPPSVADWRSYSFSEFYVGNNTWNAIRYINSTSGLPEFKLVWWCSNQSEVFRLGEDPWELTNVGGDQPTAYGQAILDQWLPVALGMSRCKGAAYQSPVPLHPMPSRPLPCREVDLPEDPNEVLLD